MRPVTDELLLGVAGGCATVIGLFLIGVFFFIETVVREPRGRLETDLQPYMRAGTRIVITVFATAMLLSLALVAFELSWARAVYVALSVILVATNVDTAIRVRAATRAIGSTTLLVNEIAGSIGVLAIVTLPWILGGLRPSREDLTLAALIALATAFASVAATALSAFDMVRLAQPVAEAPMTARPAPASPPPAVGAAAEGAAAPPAEVVTHNPAAGIYAATADYAHAIEVRHPTRILCVAGTMGLDPAGVPGASLADQLDLVWSNVRTILAASDMTVDNVVRVTSYLRDAAYAEANAAARVAALGDRPVPTTAIVTQTLAEEWLVEIELVAIA